MTRRPSFWKGILGVTLMVLLFIGTWGATSARLTRAKINSPADHAVPATSAARTSSSVAPKPPAFTVDVTSAFELDGNATASGGALDDWSTLQTGPGHAIAKSAGTAPGGVAIADLSGATIY